MARPLPKTARRTPRIDDVLDGKIRPGAHDLLRLIQTVNPTGRDLNPAERQRRYALKSRLQSLLVRRFGAELDIVRDESAEDCVSLRHRRDGRSACHAMISTLEEDARSFVRRRLDEEAAPDAPPPAPAERRAQTAQTSPLHRRLVRKRPPEPVAGDAADAAPSADSDDGEPRHTGAELIRLGLQAQDTYDYEAARRHFGAALLRPRHAPRAAVRLLALLVDNLGADSEALDLLPLLPAEIWTRTEARRLLALAAARQGREDDAAAWIQDVPQARAAEVYLALARSALRHEDMERAQDCLQEAQARDPAHPALLALRDELAGLRARRCQPLEREVLAMLDGGDLTQAAERARGYHALFPESAVFSRVIRTARERRSTAEARRLLAQATGAHAAGQPGAALSLLHEALATGVGGPLREEIQALLADLDRRRRAAEAAADVAQIADRLRTDLPAGLLGYLELCPERRAQVRQAADLPGAAQLATSWLDEINLARIAPRAAVEAVLALSQGRAVAPDDPEAAAALLAPHHRALDGIAAGRRLVRELDRRLLLRRRSEARAVATEVSEQLLAGQLDLRDAAARLQAVDLAMLDRSARTAAEEALQKAREIEEHERFTEQLDRLVESGALFSARDVLEDRLERCGPAAAALGARRTLLDDGLRARFLLRTSTEPGPPGELCDIDLTAATLQGVARVLLPGGNHLLLVCSADRYTILRVVEVDTLCVIRRILLRTPEPLYHLRTVVNPDSVWLLGSYGEALRLSWPDLRVLCWCAIESLVPIDQPVHNPQVSPDSRSLWVTRADGSQEIDVIDLRHPHLRRRLSHRLWVEPLAQPGGGLLCCPRAATQILHDSRGGIASEHPMPQGQRPEAIARHPSGDGLLLLSSAPAQQAPPVHPRRGGRQMQGRRLHLLTQIEDGPFIGVEPLSILERNQEPGLATMAREGAALVTLRETLGAYPPPGGPMHELRRYDTTPDGAALTWQVRLPGETVLAQDWHAQRTLLLSMSATGLRADDLGATPPDLSGAGVPMIREEAGLFLSMAEACAWDVGFGERAGVRLRRELNEKPGPKQTEMVRAFWERHKDDPDRLLEMVDALCSYRSHPESQWFWQKLCERHRQHPEVRLSMGSASLSHWNFEAVMRHLEDLDPALLPTIHAQHLHHVRGAAMLWCRGGVGALEELQRARALGDGCRPVLRLLEVTAPLPEPLREADLGLDLPWLRQLHGAVVFADERLQAGDAETVARVLDRRALWMLREVQALARLTEAHLALTPRTDAAWFRKVRALSAFVASHEEKHRFRRREVPYVGRAWDRERLDEIAVRARAWLPT